jgi:hypothetical protein
VLLVFRKDHVLLNTHDKHTPVIIIVKGIDLTGDLLYMLNI